MFLTPSSASGKRWITASPNSAPTARLTSTKVHFRRKRSLNESVKMPMSDIRLTIITLENA